jgi:DNA-binding NtrC family response regulator
MMRKILIVDEYEFSREFIAHELVVNGYRIVENTNPVSIKEIISEFGPDLILVDPDFQGENRWDVFFEIKIRNPEIPVIIFTGVTAYRRDPRMSLADGYVDKDADTNELRRTIEAVLEKRKESNENTDVRRNRS